MAFALRLVRCSVLLVASCGRFDFDPIRSDASIDIGTSCSAPFATHPTGCYAAFVDRVTWSEAKTRCEMLGASLVVIEDSMENDVLQGLTSGQRCWIGLTDLVEERTFVWVNGTIPVFLPWASGEPNSIDRDCVELIGANPDWNEEDCDVLRGFLCER